MESVMSYTSIPNFGDPNAKINERIHFASGARIIEVLYDARDAYGNSTEPRSNADGHGHWIAIEIDGLYQMLMWRHSRAEGGHQEYGVSRSDHPLKDLENDIKEKKSILHEARDSMHAKDYNPDNVDLILNKFSMMFSMDTPKERELNEQCQKLKEENNRKRQAFRDAEYQKRQLIAEARQLSSSTDWKSTSDRMKVMMDDWKAAGYAGKENDNLWEEFKFARQSFFDRQNRHFEELKSKRADAKRIKLSLISEAQSVAYTTDWKSGNDKMNDLMSRWKQAGSAGHEEDDRLWAEFQSVRNGYYDRRQAARDQQNSQFEARKQQKSSLISEAQSHIGDYSTATGARMKQLSLEWKGIGFCGKEYDEILWNQFRAAQDAYWSEKKRTSTAKTEAAIARRREKISRLYEQNQNLHERMNNTRNLMTQDRLYGFICENEAKIRELENEIRDMEQKLWR